MTKNVRERFFFNQTLRPFLKLVVQRCSVKKMFLEISQISQENTCARVSRDSRFRHRCLPVTLAKFLRIPFLTEHPWWLLLKTLHPIFFFFCFFFCYQFCSIVFSWNGGKQWNTNFNTFRMTFLVVLMPWKQMRFILN